MDSKGYTRLLILAFVYATPWFLQGVAESQSILDAVDQDVSLDDAQENAWEPDKFTEEADQTYNLLFHVYNKQLRPPDFVVKVDLDVTLTHVRHLDVGRQELQTVLDIELNWKDSRLQWRPYKVTEIHESTDTVWCPEIVYINGVAPVQQLYPKIVKIMHNGSVTWLKKEIVTTRCDTEPSTNFQNCAIKIGFVLNGVREKDQNRFFFSDDSSASVGSEGNVFSHAWNLRTMDMNMENETKSSTIDLELGFEYRGKGDHHHRNGEDGMTEASSHGGGGATVYTTDNSNIGHGHHGNNDGGSAAYGSGRGNRGGGGGGWGSNSNSGCGCPNGGGSVIVFHNIRYIWVLTACSLLLGFLVKDGGLGGTFVHSR